MAIKVLTQGLLSIIEDSGRFDYQQFGTCVTGVMDSFSQRLANILVENDELEAVIEMTVVCSDFEFLDNHIIAITGGDFSPKLNGENIINYRSYKVKKGDKLTFSGARNGTRAYLAVAGGFDIPIIMGSKSTYIKAKIGGFDGRALKKDDIIEVNILNDSFDDFCCLEIPEKYIPTFSKEINVKVVLGPQDDGFSETGLQTFLNSPYKITSQCDRMGYRLEGELIAHKDGSDIVSDGIVMGSVQVPSDGKPIILMADRQTTGGYTKIATIISADLPKVSQCKSGDTIYFATIDIYEAQKIYLENEQLINDIKNNLIKAKNPMEKVQYSKDAKFYDITLNDKKYAVVVEEIG